MMLDQSQNGSNIFSDPKLPHLAAVMDDGLMAEHFARHLRAASPGLEWQVAQCAIENVIYKPAKHCRLLYRLGLRHPSGAAAEEWFYGQLYPPGLAEKRFDDAVASVKHSYVAHDFLKGLQPVSYWQDLNMVLWMFPHDPQMATLPYLLDPGFVRRQVEANPQALGVFDNGADSAAETWRCAGIRCDRVKYMPGKRCVLRYHVRFSGPSGESREMTFYSKTYSDAMSRYHFEFLQTAYGQLTAQTAAIHIPRPLLHLDGFNTFWQEDWKGRELSAVIDEFDWEEFFPRIAKALAAWHRIRVANLRRGPDPDDVLRMAQEDGGKLISKLPQLQPLVSTALERLEAAQGALVRQEIPIAPIHGALRPSQMLIRGAELAMVDFDDIALGDPLFDVAEFIASLLYQEMRAGKPRQKLARTADLFLGSYAAHVPWSCDRRRIAWHVVAFLINKMCSSVKHRDVLTLQRIESTGHELINSWLEFIN
jgi:thiamine kinase-like enzyme